MMTTEENDPQVLIDQGYYRTSNKYRSIARMPAGMSALTALANADPRVHAYIMNLAERHARSLYLSTYCPDQLSRTLSREDFDAFKRAGGECA